MDGTRLQKVVVGVFKASPEKSKHVFGIAPTKPIKLSKSIKD